MTDRLAARLPDDDAAVFDGIDLPELTGWAIEVRSLRATGFDERRYRAAATGTSGAERCQFIGDVVAAGRLSRSRRSISRSS